MVFLSALGYATLKASYMLNILPFKKRTALMPLISPDLSLL